MSGWDELTLSEQAIVRQKFAEGEANQENVDAELRAEKAERKRLKREHQEAALEAKAAKRQKLLDDRKQSRLLEAKGQGAAAAGKAEAPAKKTKKEPKQKEPDGPKKPQTSYCALLT